MKKLTHRKLVVRRETLRMLERVELAQVAGGETTHTGDVDCPTGKPNLIKTPVNA